MADCKEQNLVLQPLKVMYPIVKKNIEEVNDSQSYLPQELWERLNMLYQVVI